MTKAPAESIRASLDNLTDLGAVKKVTAPEPT